jgi:putative flippase GtrA
MKRFVAYILAGGAAATLNWSSRFLFSIWFSYAVSIVLAFFVGLSSGFILMRWLVFDGAGKPAVPQAGMYVLVNAFALIQTLAVSLILAKWVIPAVGYSANPEGPAHLVGVVVPAVTSYFGHKYLTFK